MIEPGNFNYIEKEDWTPGINIESCLNIMDPPGYSFVRYYIDQDKLKKRINRLKRYKFKKWIISILKKIVGYK